MPSTTSLKKQIPRSIIFLMLLFSSSQLYAAAFLLGPMLGHVDDHSAKIWCALDEKGEIELKISEDPEFKNARIISQKDFELGSISIDGLKADTLYEVDPKVRPLRS
ncbi:MAG: hypothetical protein OSA93_18285 [Akkermansiaceae bacterium]|nr:hypothetical protein [Akkermansiaceae bacterium]